MMEQREKLIELLKLASLDPANDAMMGQHDAEYYADFLIENGVVVLPCNASVIEWHEVKTRPLDDEEKEYYAEMCMEPEYIFVGTMPDDGQEILVATKFGVDRDICCNDGEYGIGLEQNGDWDGVLAWAEMPTYAKRKGGTP